MVVALKDRIKQTIDNISLRSLCGKFVVSMISVEFIWWCNIGVQIFEAVVDLYTLHAMYQTY